MSLVQIDTPKNLKTTITEYTIQQLEANAEQLRNAVYSENTVSSWSIHVLQNDNLFTQNGVRDGDIITFESLDAQRSDPTRAPLADRMERILNRIRR